MNKTAALVKRNLKEIIRDPLSLVFNVAFPILMLFLLGILINGFEYVPEQFLIENYSVGICVFGYTFAMLFAAMLIAEDKNAEFVNRLDMAPISKAEYVASYYLALAPVVIFQTVLFLLCSCILGLEFSVRLLIAFAYLMPSAALYVALGALIGAIVKSAKQAGPICSVIISGTSLLGGVFMPVNNLGTFSTIVNLLPFTHSVKIATGVFGGDYGCIYPHVLWVVGYTVIVFIITVLLFKRKK
ncbi:MAG: ABC transporter permease [Clostridia bacterium]|nr:ABC transporter permease [Clostridia bacterium]